MNKVSFFSARELITSCLINYVSDTDFDIWFTEFTHIPCPKSSTIYKMLTLDGTTCCFYRFYLAILINNFGNCTILKYCNT